MKILSIFMFFLNVIDIEAKELIVYSSNQKCLLKTTEGLHSSIQKFLKNDESFDSSQYLTYGLLLEASSPASLYWSLVGVLYKNGKLEFNVIYKKIIFVNTSLDVSKEYLKEKVFWVPVDIRESN